MVPWWTRHTITQHPCDGALHRALHAQLVPLTGPGQDITWSLQLLGFLGYCAVEMAQPALSRTGTFCGSALQCPVSSAAPLSFISWTGRAHQQQR